MHKEFTLYAEAFELKLLGFDEPCFGRFYYKDVHSILRPNSYEKELFYESGQFLRQTEETILLPTYSQAFRFFREKFKLHSYIEGAYPWFRFYINSNDDRVEGYKHLIYEEAELACLHKLIEIVKQTQSSTTDKKYDYVKSNEDTLPILKRLYGDCATDKTATFQIKKNNEQQ